MFFVRFEAFGLEFDETDPKNELGTSRNIKYNFSKNLTLVNVKVNADVSKVNADVIMLTSSQAVSH